MHDKDLGPVIFVANSIKRWYVLRHAGRVCFPSVGDIEMEEGPIYFQQDGVSPHNSLRWREALDNRIGGRWIDREIPTPWPPRSTDLTP